MLLSLPGVTFFLWLVRNVQAITVITIDDQDPSIVYAPLSSWGKFSGPGLDAGGTHMMSSDPNATATLTTRFLTAHIWSARYPYLVTTDISVDGRNNSTMNFQDPNAPVQPTGGGAMVASSIILSFTGNTTQEHTIVLSVHPGDLYVVVDQFTFEVEDDPIANVTTSPPIPTSTAAPSSESSPTSSSTTSSASGEATNTPQSPDATPKKKPSSVPIIIAVIVAALVLSLVGVTVFIVCRRRRRRKPARFLYESPFNWRKKHQTSQDDVASDRSDALRTRSSLTRQSNIPSSPAPLYSADRSRGGATDDARTTRAGALYQATTTPTNALRVMNNPQSRHYPSGVTLSTPFSEKQMPMPIPLHAAASSGTGLVADVNDSASRQLNGDCKEPNSKDKQWSTKSLERQSGPVQPPPYQA